jgi:hypothetical protein
MVGILKRRFLAAVILLVVAAMVLPTTALAYNWTRSPVSPLVVGGVHSEGSFKHVILNHKRVQLAIKGVMAADHTPSWVYAAAISQVQAGDIHSSSLGRGTNIGAMAFGPRTTKIVKNTVWRGNGRLPYYYVNATQSVVQDGYRIDTTYRVALAKTCGNPFVTGPTVTRTLVVTPVYNLYVEKRRDSLTGPRLAGWSISGTAGGKSIDEVTSSEDKVLIGSYPAGTAYSVQEDSRVGWSIVSPAEGIFIGNMPAQDLTLTFVNHENVTP